jgi:hypothetical protein
MAGGVKGLDETSLMEPPVGMEVWDG